MDARNAPLRAGDDWARELATLANLAGRIEDAVAFVRAVWSQTVVAAVESEIEAGQLENPSLHVREMERRFGVDSEAVLAAFRELEGRGLVVPAEDGRFVWNPRGLGLPLLAGASRRADHDCSPECAGTAERDGLEAWDVLDADRVRKVTVTRALETEIVAGQLDPGATVGIAETASRFGVGRSAARRALRILMGRGLVVDQGPGRPPLVASPRGWQADGGGWTTR